MAAVGTGSPAWACTGSTCTGSTCTDQTHGWCAQFVAVTADQHRRTDLYNCDDFAMWPQANELRIRVARSRHIIHVELSRHSRAATSMDFHGGPAQEYWGTGEASWWALGLPTSESRLAAARVRARRRVPLISNARSRRCRRSHSAPRPHAPTVRRCAAYVQG